MFITSQRQRSRHSLAQGVDGLFVEWKQKGCKLTLLKVFMRKINEGEKKKNPHTSGES